MEESSEDQDGEDAVNEIAQNIPDVSEQPGKKPRVKRGSKSKREKLTAKIVETYLSSTFYSETGILPNAIEASLMVRPIVNIADRAGWLETDHSDSIIVDIALLAIGTGIYGYRLTKQLEKSKKDNERKNRHNDRGTGEDTQDVTSNAALYAHHDEIESGETSHFDPDEKVKRLLESDYIGRRKLGLA